MAWRSIWFAHRGLRYTDWLVCSRHDERARLSDKPETARNRLLGAALRIIREKGYHATSVEELCRAAGVTEGAFFHYFGSKEDLAVAAAEHWSMTTGDCSRRRRITGLPTRWTG